MGELSGSELKKRQKKLAKELLGEISRLAEEFAASPAGQQADGSPRVLRFMEVCGTHTVAIFRAGLRQLLPENIQLVSGPGCPVCVTDNLYMDKAIAYAKNSDVILTTFGDMLKVPGSESSLAEAKAQGADIRIVYSSMDSLIIARENPTKKVIFLAVGFETTAPTAAATVLAAKQQEVQNFYMLSAHKLVPPALHMLLADPLVQVDGFILPGHVCVVTGTELFQFLPSQYGMPGVVTGFEPVELLRSIYRLLQQVMQQSPAIANEYSSVVRVGGNPQALQVMDTVYEPTTAQWRGLGEIAASGLRMRKEFASYDIEKVMPLELQPTVKKTACRCGEVLRGIITPSQCPLFGKVCTPEHAIGPCMVSVEGSCAAWYKYGSGRFSYGK